MFKKVLFAIVMSPLYVIGSVSAWLTAAVMVLAKPISAAFGLKKEYDNNLDYMVDYFDDIKDGLKFN